MDVRYIEQLVKSEIGGCRSDHMGLRGVPLRWSNKNVLGRYRGVYSGRPRGGEDN